MSANLNEPFAGFDRALHEPKRLAIVSSLAARGSAEATFRNLKEECSLTDGNLNRHLKVLEEAGVVTVQKVEGKGGRPRTEVRLTAAGREHFLRYLDALEQALTSAAKAIGRPAGAGKKQSLVPRRDGLRNQTAAGRRLSGG
jgi:DNA-binding transcriptional ArsR family regulator